MTRGTREKAKELLLLTQGGTERNTAFLERLNGTFRERLASFPRKCRHAAARRETLETGMSLIGCTSTFCWPHQELSKNAHCGCPTTPALAAALTDHIWSIRELLCDNVAPASWVQTTLPKPKRSRGRPRKPAEAEQTLPKRPRGRPPTSILAEVFAAARTAGAFTN